MQKVYCVTQKNRSKALYLEKKNLKIPRFRISLQHFSSSLVEKIACAMMEEVASRGLHPRRMDGNPTHLSTYLITVEIIFTYHCI